MANGRFCWNVPPAWVRRQRRLKIPKKACPCYYQNLPCFHQHRLDPYLAPLTDEGHSSQSFSSVSVAWQVEGARQNCLVCSPLFHNSGRVVLIKANDAPLRYCRTSLPQTSCCCCCHQTGTAVSCTTAIAGLADRQADTGTGLLLGSHFPPGWFPATLAFDPGFTCKLGHYPADKCFLMCFLASAPQPNAQREALGVTHVFRSPFSTSWNFSVLLMDA